MAGGDRLDFLHRLTTNATLGLSAGDGTATVITNAKGRIEDFLSVYEEGDSTILVCGPGQSRRVADWFETYHFTEDLTISDETDETSMFGVHGPSAERFLSDVASLDLGGLPLYHHLTVAIADGDVTVARAKPLAGSAFHLICRRQAASQLWDWLIDSGEAHGLRPLGAEAYEVLRIEEGIPLYGRELTDDFNPLEAGLLEAVDFSKGCYIGQEVIARLDTYDKVQKRLRGLLLDDVLPDGGSPRLLLNEKEAGVVTSQVRSRLLNRPIALAYVRKAADVDGGPVTVEAGDSKVGARVVTLPFTRREES